MSSSTGPLQWAIFCRVIDNFGDIGVCWRLAGDLARRGHRVQLWLDDSAALAWMAPVGCEGVEVLAWTTPWAWPASTKFMPVDVMVEAFGCEIAPEFIAEQTKNAWASGKNRSKNSLDSQQNNQQPVWINLEYLSAEAYVERCHALPSLQSSGPRPGWTKWFFYPGFTPLTGGLLREQDLADRQSRFDKAHWLSAQGLPIAGEKRISLFSYEPAALSALLRQLAASGFGGEPVRLLVAAGRAEKAVKKALKQALETHFHHQITLQPMLSLPGLLSISYLALLSQADYDHLLWASDANFVRGEDSLVRAIWAGKPWVWHIYPQDDGAHHAKLEALMNRLGTPLSLRAFHRIWNADNAPDDGLVELDWSAWQSFAHKVQNSLSQQTDLTGQLIDFVAAKKS